jgi:hypothetical protein
VSIVRRQLQKARYEMGAGRGAAADRGDNMIPDTEGLKRCPRCTLRKKPELFNRSKHEVDGRDCYCKFCRNEISKQWRRANPAAYALTQRNDTARKRRQYADRKETDTPHAKA